MKEHMVFQGIRFNVHELEIPVGDGKWVKRHVARHPGAVVIVPILNDGRIVLIRNTRATVGKTLLELPAGTREPGEPPEVTADRELKEETGYTAGKIQEVLQFYASPGITDERMYLYVARDLTLGEHAREAGELIENEPHAWDQIEQKLDNGAFEDGKTIAGLLYVKRWLEKNN